MTDWKSDINKLMESMKENIGSGKKPEAAQDLKDAYQLLRNASGFARVQPEWKQAVEIYQSFYLKCYVILEYQYDMFDSDKPGYGF